MKNTRWLAVLLIVILMSSASVTTVTAISVDDASATTENTGYAVEFSEEHTENESIPETLTKATVSVPDENSVYQAIIAMKSQYPEGMRWTNDNFYAWNGGIYSGGYGCAGFAFLLSDAAFGNLPARTHQDYDHIRVGDIVRVNYDSHSVVALEVHDTYIIVAEGNYNSSVHWGRQISIDSIKSNGSYVMTRYPETTFVAVNQIQLSKSNAFMQKGESLKLTATVLPSNATNPKVTWSSSDPSVVTVNAEGVVKAIGNGTASVTCMAQDGSSVKAVCKISVSSYQQVKDFCARLYEKCLGRTPESSGLEYWTNELVTGKQSGVQVGYGFVFSPEYIRKHTGNEEFVEMMYAVFLDRSADAAGKAYWVDLLNQGLSRQYVFQGFAHSAEYTALCKSYGIERGTYTLTQARDQKPELTKFINRIYTKVMNRKGEEEGLNYWCGQVLNGQKTPVQVAESFFFAPEFVNKKTSNREYVQILYRTFMGREADQAGMDYWVGRLNSGESRNSVLKSFAGCPEFQTIIKSFGL